MKTDMIFLTVVSLLIDFLKIVMKYIEMRNSNAMNLIHTTSEGHELWLGNYHAAINTNLLEEKNIKSGKTFTDIVLTAAAMLNIHYDKELFIKHKIIHCFDDSTYKMTQHFEEAYKFIKKSLQDGNILVHCAAGIARVTGYCNVSQPPVCLSI